MRLPLALIALLAHAGSGGTEVYTDAYKRHIVANDDPVAILCDEVGWEPGSSLVWEVSTCRRGIFYTATYNYTYSDDGANGADRTPDIVRRKPHSDITIFAKTGYGTIRTMISFIGRLSMIGRYRCTVTRNESRSVQDTYLVPPVAVTTGYDVLRRRIVCQVHERLKHVNISFSRSDQSLESLPCGYNARVLSEHDSWKNDVVQRPVVCEVRVRGCEHLPPFNHTIAFDSTLVLKSVRTDPDGTLRSLQCMYTGDCRGTFSWSVSSCFRNGSSPCFAGDSLSKRYAATYGDVISSLPMGSAIVETRLSRCVRQAATHVSRLDLPERDYVGRYDCAFSSGIATNVQTFVVVDRMHRALAHVSFTSWLTCSVRPVALRRERKAYNASFVMAAVSRSDYRPVCTKTAYERGSNSVRATFFSAVADPDCAVIYGRCALPSNLYSDPVRGGR